MSALIQVLIAVSVYGILSYLYKDHGAPQYWTIARNASVLSNPQTFLIFEKLEPIYLAPFGFSFWYPTGLNLLVLSVVSFLVWKNWNLKNVHLRLSLFIIVPLSVSGLLFGFIDEIRIFYEIVPVVFWLACGAVPHGTKQAV